jgi:carboxymethylenebutenolidase
MGHYHTLTAHDGHTFPAWVCEPSGKPRGGVVVIQEIFGVNAHIRGVAERFATAGWLAVAPDVMHRARVGVALGYDEAGVNEGRQLVAEVGFDNALRDVAAAAQYAECAGRVGVVGFCWGGTLALLACTRLKLPAVSYYGGRTLPFLHERPGAPLLMHFGQHDPIIKPEHVTRIRAAFPEATIHVYDAGHGFNCEARADYDAAAATLAAERTEAFFKQVLT